MNPKILFVVVFLIALLFRLWGINYDLPYIYHPDEPVALAILQTMLRTGDLNPHFFHWPSFLLYVNLAIYIPYYLLGKLLGVFQSPGEILDLTQLAMGVTYTSTSLTVLLGRLITVTFSLGSVLLTFLIGRQLSGKLWVGLIAAFMIAISPTNVGQSRFITPDTFATFFILASFLMSVLIFQKGGIGYYLLGGIFIGLAASSKYNGVLAVIPLLIAHFLSRGWTGLKDYKLVLSLGLTALFFLTATPFAVLDYPAFLVDLNFDRQHYATGHPGMEGATLQWYLNYLWQTTGPLYLLAALEILRGLYIRSKPLILLSSFPLLYFLFISRFIVRNERTILPLTPFLFLLAASFLVYLFGRVGEVKLPGARRWGLAGLTALAFFIIIRPGFRTVGDNLNLMVITSRETARVWIEDSCQRGRKWLLSPMRPL
jgi:4-amino-4-deoxy-L-arabinose transferase-like glycosyltransferase